MKHLLLEIKHQSAHVTLNRPKVRNAFHSEMIQEMTETFESLQNEKDLRAVYISGAGESFCAGADLNWMKSMVNFTEAENLRDSELLYEMYESLKNIPVPVVCYVHGHAMGGALGLVAASNIVFAAEKTQMCFSEVRLGLAPAVISAFLKDKILPRDMSRFFLTAEIFDGKQAYDMGLIHGYGSQEAMREKAEKLTDKIATNAPKAVRATKRLISELGESDSIKEKTTELIAKLRVSDEGQEGLRAFLEKRKPLWLEPETHGKY